MSKRYALALVVVAGGLMPLVANAQSRQVSPKANAQRVEVKKEAPRVQKQLQTLDVAKRVHAQRVAKFRMIDGKAVVVSDWMPIVPNPTDAPDTVYFDAYEADPTGLPTGFCGTPCTQLNSCPGAPPSNRWWFGMTYNNPFTVRDMTILPGAANAEATRVLFAWNWQPGFPNQCIVGIFTAETFNDCTAGPPGSAGDFDGMVYDFGIQAPGAGYFYADEDLSMTPGAFHKMPVNGTGAYGIIIANAVDPVTGELTIETGLGTQPMLWGTGNNINPPAQRVGSQGPFGWDDDAPANGQHTAVECYDNTITGADICPNPPGPMIMFMGEPVGSTCYANCDGSTATPILNIDDFTCFINAFAIGSSLSPEEQVNHYSNCDGSTAVPVLNIDDFTCFINAFAAGC